MLRALSAADCGLTVMIPLASKEDMGHAIKWDFKYHMNGNVSNSNRRNMKDITGAQIRAARALLRWTSEELAKGASVGISTVRRAEAGDGVPSMTAANLKAVRAALEEAGIEFIAENGGGAGVRFRAPAAGSATDG